MQIVKMVRRINARVENRKKSGWVPCKQAVVPEFKAYSGYIFPKLSYHVQHTNLVFKGCVFSTCAVTMSVRLLPQITVLCSNKHIHFYFFFKCSHITSNIQKVEWRKRPFNYIPAYTQQREANHWGECTALNTFFDQTYIFITDNLHNTLLKLDVATLKKKKSFRLVK